MVDFNVLNPKIVLDFNRLVPGGSASYAALILKDDPVLYYRFQEGAGAPLAQDSSPHFNIGYYEGSEGGGIHFGQESPIMGDKQDSSLFFDGGFVDTPGSPSLNPAFTEITVELWVRFDGPLPESERTLIGRGTGPGPNNFQLSVVPDGRVKFWFAQTTAQSLAFSDSPLVPNVWYHVAAVWDGARQRVYLNGYEGMAVPNTAGPGPGAEDIQVGAYNNASRITAFIDEVAIYRRALPREAIIQRPPFHKWDNLPPLITATTANGVSPGNTLTIYQGEPVELITQASDPDGDSLLYQFSVSGYIPEYGPQTDNHITITFPEVGTYFPVAFVSDGLAVRSAPFAKIVVERVPDLQAFNDFYTTGFQRAVTMDVLENDTFPAGLSDVIDSWTLPEHGTLERTTGDRFRYVPDPDFQDAEDTFTYTITNGQGAYDEAEVTIYVAPKKMPVINDISYYIAFNQTRVLTPTSNDEADPPSQAITIVNVQNPTEQGGVVEIISGTQVRYTPPQDYWGPDSFVYLAEDEDGFQGSATVSLTITQEAVVPFRASNDSYVVSFGQSRVLYVLSNDSTPYPEPLYITEVTQPPGGSASIQPDQTSILFTPDPGFFGDTSFQYTMTDGTHFDDASVSIRVRNDPPQPGTIRRSTLLNTALVLDLVAPAYDREGETITLRSFGQPSSGTTTQDPQNPDAVIYTPNTNFRGIDSFPYVIEDASGLTATGTARIAVDFTMDITVGPRSIPVTESISYQVTVSAASGYDKSYTYFWDFGDGNTATRRTGTHRFSGIGTFEVSCVVTDSYGVSHTLTETIEVGANRPPVANDVYVTVAEGQELIVDPRLNDFDPDGDRFFLVPYQGLSAKGGQVATDTAGTPTNPYDDFFRYTHPLNLEESPFQDWFEYTIEDEYGLRAMATVYITVLVNQPPVAEDIYRPVIYNTPTPIYVLRHVSDPEGDDLFVTDARDVSGGVVDIEGYGPDNYITFTPDPDFLGQASLTYEVRDSFHNYAEALITIPVFGKHYPKKVYDDEPVAFWPLNEGSGSRAYDMMPDQRTGTYINQIGRDKLGPLALDLEHAASLDRGSVSLPLRDLSLTEQFSLEFWLKVTQPASHGAINDVMSIEADATRYDFRIRTSEGTKIISIPEREVGEWYYVVMTYDGEWARIYIDGEVLGSTPHTGSIIMPRTLQLGTGMSGQMTMVALYDKALGPEQVEAHYEEALGPVVAYDIVAPETMAAGGEMVVTIKGRDITGKTVKTENTKVVTLTSDDPSIKFDADLDGNYE